MKGGLDFVARLAPETCEVRFSVCGTTTLCKLPLIQRREKEREKW